MTNLKAISNAKKPSRRSGRLLRTASPQKGYFHRHWAAESRARPAGTAFPATTGKGSYEPPKHSEEL